MDLLVVGCTETETRNNALTLPPPKRPGDCGLGVVQARSSTGRQMRGSGREKRKEISHAYSSKVMNGTLVV